MFSLEKYLKLLNLYEKMTPGIFGFSLIILIDKLDELNKSKLRIG